MAIGYLPPLVSESKALHAIFYNEQSELYPGVQGMAFENGAEIWIPFIRAKQEGSGQVGKFLDALDARCCVIEVCSKRLVGMLERRGWVRTMETFGRAKIDVWRKSPV